MKFDTVEEIEAALALRDYEIGRDDFKAALEALKAAREELRVLEDWDERELDSDKARLLQERDQARAELDASKTLDAARKRIAALEAAPAEAKEERAALMTAVGAARIERDDWKARYEGLAEAARPIAEWTARIEPWIGSHCPIRLLWTRSAESDDITLNHLRRLAAAMMEAPESDREQPTAKPADRSNA